MWGFVHKDLTPETLVPKGHAPLSSLLVYPPDALFLLELPLCRLCVADQSVVKERAKITPRYERAPFILEVGKDLSPGEFGLEVRVWASWTKAATYQSDLP